jgi:hypothetical protein
MYITKTSISKWKNCVRATWRSGLCKFVRVGQVWKMKILHEGGGVWGVSRVILRLFYTLYHAVTKKKSRVFFFRPHNRPTLRNFLRVGGMWKLKFLHKGGSVWGVSGVEPGLFYTLCHTKQKKFPHNFFRHFFPPSTLTSHSTYPLQRVGQVWNLKFFHKGGSVRRVPRVILRLFYTLYYVINKKKIQSIFFQRVGQLWTQEFSPSTFQG